MSTIHSYLEIWDVQSDSVVVGVATNIVYKLRLQEEALQLTMFTLCIC